MNGEVDQRGYDQLFRMIEDIHRSQTERDIEEAKFQGEVMAKLAALPCKDQSREVADLGRRTRNLELQAAAAKPFAVLGMALLGGILVGLATKFIA